MPIQRAKMELLLLMQPEFKEDMEAALTTNNVDFSQPQENEKAQFLKYQILVDPSLYRILNDAMQKMPGARIEIVNQVVTKQGDVDLEVEVGQKSNSISMIAATNTSDETAGFATQKMPSQTNTFVSHDDKDDDGFGDSGAGRRKAQKKNKKKNRKQQRRAAESNDTEVESLGQSLSSQLKVDGPNTPASASAAASTNSNSSDGRKSCNTCGGFFDSPAEFRAHFKSDWHRFNQKLKMKGCTPVSEKEFLMCDSDTFFTGDSMIL
mmetsp:Transcript_14659/g.30296  ORF Transcript_14659/g.30296 Transcript_14659/m.30296 type:complete len:265 (+) Transcript_14659:1-795(+)